jgi:hypothetical protein
MKAIKTISGIATLIATLAIAQTLNADVLQSPRAAANQARQVSGTAIDADLAHNSQQNIIRSTRAEANQPKVVAGSSASDRDFAHNRGVLNSGKDQVREQYARYLKATGADSYQLAPIK